MPWTRGPVVPVAAVVLVLATPVATWWLVGDLSEPVADADYLIRPVDIPRAVQTAAGIVAVLLVLAAAVVLGAALRKRSLDRKWLPPIVFLAVAGMITGAGWRVLTAGVAGANIGGGMVILFGGPVVILLVVAAIVTSRMKAVRR